MPISFLILALSAVPHVAVDTTVRIGRGTGIEIEAYNRSVLISTGTGDEVQISDGDLELRDGKVSIEAAAFGARSEPLRVVVPSWASVMVELVNGSLEVTVSPASLDAEVVNGPILVRKAGGALRLFNGTGGVTVDQFHGTRLDIESINGPVVVTDASGQVAIDAISGGVSLAGMRTNKLTVSSISGNISWEGQLMAGSSHHLETHDGNIDITLPRNASARMSLELQNGRFSSDVPSVSDGTGASRSGSGRHGMVLFGSGGAQFVVSSFNGSARVTQGT